jgi:hypothetical protein
VSLLDDHSKFSVCVPLRAKSDAAAAVQQVISKWENLLDKRVNNNKLLQDGRIGRGDRNPNVETEDTATAKAHGKRA